MGISKIFLITFSCISFLVSHAYGREPMVIKSLDDIPPDQAIEAKFPDGSIRTVASITEPIPQGISQARAVTLAKKIARVKAQAAIADFVNGSEFSQSVSVEHSLRSIEENGKASGKFTVEEKEGYTAEMRSLALRGVELLETSTDPSNGTVRVIVGYGIASLEAADRNAAMLNKNHANDANNALDNNSSATHGNSDYIHPMFRTN